MFRPSTALAASTFSSLRPLTAASSRRIPAAARLAAIGQHLVHRPFSASATMSEKTSQGHEVVKPPNTGWKGEIPSKKGGSEAGYLLKPPYVWRSDEFEVKYTAKCWCGKLEFEYHGDPIDAKHCHCTQCQRLHGAPFQWAALFHKTSVRLAESCDPIYLDFFSTQEGHSDHSVPCKISCRNCRSPMADEGRNMVMAYPSSFRFKDGHVPSTFAPTAHIFYGERVMDVDDDVPKWSGHKESSELMPHAPKEEGDRTFGKDKTHKKDKLDLQQQQQQQQQQNGDGEGGGGGEDARAKRPRNGA